MQDQNSNTQNADTHRDDAFPSPDGPQKATTTTNLDTGEIEPLRNSRDEPADDEDNMDFASGSDGGSAGDGAAG